MSAAPAQAVPRSAVSRIVAHCAPQHAQLREDLAALAHAPDELAELEQYLRDLRIQITVDEEKTKKAQRTAYASEYAYIDVKHSLVRKIGSLMTGKGDKWKAKQTDMLNTHHEDQDRLMELKDSVSRGKASVVVTQEKINTLRPVVERHAQLLHDLDELYAQIFDSQETDQTSDDGVFLWNVRRAEASKKRAHEVHVLETQTVAHLRTARVALDQCYEELLKAKQYSASGNASSMKKAIARAQNQADEYHSSVKQAAALNSGMGTTAANAADELVANVAAIGSSRTTHQTSYHEKIFQGKEASQRAASAFSSEVEIAEQRMKRAELEAKRTTDALENVLKVLRQHRHEQFVRILAENDLPTDRLVRMGAHTTEQQATDLTVSPPAYEAPHGSN